MKDLIEFNCKKLPPSAKYKGFKKVFLQSEAESTSTFDNMHVFTLKLKELLVKVLDCPLVKTVSDAISTCIVSKKSPKGLIKITDSFIKNVKTLRKKAIINFVQTIVPMYCSYEDFNKHIEYLNSGDKEKNKAKKAAWYGKAFALLMRLIAIKKNH